MSTFNVHEWNRKRRLSEEEEFDPALEQMQDEVEEMEAMIEKVDGPSNAFGWLIAYLNVDREGAERVHAALKKVVKKLVK